MKINATDTLCELEVNLTFHTDQQYRQLSAIMNMLNADVLNVECMGKIEFYGTNVRVTFMTVPLVMESNWLAIEQWCSGHGFKATRCARV